jgi:alpha-glucosidase (family GH31 glycosyl hydrolase)
MVMQGLHTPAQDQYMEITSTIPQTASLYGVGEHIFSSGLLLRRDGAPMALWTRDNAASEPDQNTYGAWPFVLDVRQGDSLPPRALSWVAIASKSHHAAMHEGESAH